MKFMKLASSAIMAAVLTLAAGASASDTVYHGSLCNPQPPDVSKIDYNQFGSFNIAATTGTVSCGTGTQILATVNTVSIIAYDRNSSTNVSCTVMLTDIFGNSLFTQNKTTTGNSAGSQTLNYTPGVGTHTVYVRCDIPAVTASGNSVVASYRIITP